MHVRGIVIGMILSVTIANFASRVEAKNIKLQNFQAAEVVIGQPDFTSNGAGVGADKIRDAYGNPWLASGVLFVPVFLNAQVLGFTGVPKVNGASADFVLGEPDFNTDSGGTGPDQLAGPVNVVSAGHHLIVDDYSNNRILIWNKIPKSTAAPADLVLGQSGFGSKGFGCGPTMLAAPETVWAAGGKLVVADSGNNRILIWKKIPKVSDQAPDLVLGQGDLVTCVDNNDGTGNPGSAPSAANLSFPAAIWTNGKRLIVVDNDNNRVLIWKKFPTRNFQPADLVLGQPDFVSSVPNNDGLGNSGQASAQNLNDPFDGLYSNGTQVFVADNDNNRVLIWNRFPTSNFQAANRVLGQPDFSCGAKNNDGSGTCKSGPPSAGGLAFPEGVIQIGNRLIVNDNGNNRYLIYKGN